MTPQSPPLCPVCGEHPATVKWGSMVICDLCLLWLKGEDKPIEPEDERERRLM